MKKTDDVPFLDEISVLSEALAIMTEKNIGLGFQMQHDGVGK